MFSLIKEHDFKNFVLITIFGAMLLALAFSSVARAASAPSFDLKLSNLEGYEKGRSDNIDATLTISNVAGLEGAGCSSDSYDLAVVPTGGITVNPSTVKVYLNGCNRTYSLDNTNWHAYGTSTDSEIVVTNSSTMDSFDIGHTFGMTIANFYGLGSAIERVVYEVPFARFFGNDVNVCGAGSGNRFVFDDRLGVTNLAAKKGSFSEYASIYTSGNNPSSTYSGLNSATASNGFPGSLLTDYADMSCVSGLVSGDDFTPTVGANAVIDASDWNGNDSKFIYINGSTTINSQLINNGSGPFDPDTYPVLLIYATGAINIDNDVDRIDAILISETEINTCVKNASGAAIDPADYHETPNTGCRSPLVINGAISAPTVNLQRTGGSRYLADDLSPGWKDNTIGGDTKASEIINYPWYLNFININGLVENTNIKLDAYYGLPPRL